MKVKYIKSAAGVQEGSVRELPEHIAKVLIDRGIVKKESSINKVVKEEKKEIETKEEKVASKRKTKSKK